MKPGDSSARKSLQAVPSDGTGGGDSTGTPTAALEALVRSAGGSSKPLQKARLSGSGTAASTRMRPVPVQPGTAPPGSSPDSTAVAPTGRTTIRQEGDDDEASPDELKKFLEGTPPWLVSTIVHVVGILILGFIVYKVSQPKKPIVVHLPEPEEIWAEEIGKQLMDETAKFDVEKPQEKQVISDSPFPEVSDPFATPPQVEEVVEGVKGSTQTDLKAPDVGLALTGRHRGRRNDLLAAYGGTKRTEDAVILALEWLARQQRADGSWSLQGPYSDGGLQENVVSATAMALLAFQGHGDVHNKESRFQKNVANGWKALLKFLDKQGSFFATANLPSHHNLYTQAQAAIAICEIYGMTEDPAFKEPAQRVVDYICKIQDKQGGWRYFPGDDSDTSVSGWFMMALQSARMAKLNVPDATLQNLSKFLDSVAMAGGSQYRYRVGDVGLRPAMTAEGLLCRQYLGWPQDDQRMHLGAKYLLTNHPMMWTPQRRDVYYWYYATQTMHHLEGEAWTAWNGVMRQMLPTHQIKQGQERGSWDPKEDKWGSVGGRLYVTCLSVYMLEVYYRHLPIYSKLYR